MVSKPDKDPSDDMESAIRVTAGRLPGYPACAATAEMLNCQGLDSKEMALMLGAIRHAVDSAAQQVEQQTGVPMVQMVDDAYEHQRAETRYSPDIELRDDEAET